MVLLFLRITETANPPRRFVNLPGYEMLGESTDKQWAVVSVVNDDVSAEMFRLPLTQVTVQAGSMTVPDPTDDNPNGIKVVPHMQTFAVFVPGIEQAKEWERVIRNRYLGKWQNWEAGSVL